MNDLIFYLIRWYTRYLCLQMMRLFWNWKKHESEPSPALRLCFIQARTFRLSNGSRAFPLVSSSCCYVPPLVNFSPDWPYMVCWRNINILAILIEQNFFNLLPFAFSTNRAVVLKVSLQDEAMTTSNVVRYRQYHRVITTKTHSLPAALALEDNTEGPTNIWLIIFIKNITCVYTKTNSWCIQKEKRFRGRKLIL